MTLGASWSLRKDLAGIGGLLLSGKTPTLNTVIPVIQQRPLLSTILKPLDTIECCDAILTPDSTEPEGRRRMS